MAQSDGAQVCWAANFPKEMTGGLMYLVLTPSMVTLPGPIRFSKSYTTRRSFSSSVGALLGCDPERVLFYVDRSNLSEVYDQDADQDDVDRPALLPPDAGKGLFSVEDAWAQVAGGLGGHAVGTAFLGHWAYVVRS